MIYHGVICERVEPIAPEGYICAWPDRNQLVLGMLSEGKGTRIVFKPRIKDAPGIAGRDFAYIEVESYSQ